MQTEINLKDYDPEDWDKAVYLVERGFVKRDHVNKLDDIRETAVNIYNAKCKTDEHPFEGK